MLNFLTISYIIVCFDYEIETRYEYIVKYQSTYVLAVVDENILFCYFI